MKGQLKAAAKQEAVVIAIVEPDQVTFRRRGQDEVVVATADAKSELERQLSAAGNGLSDGGDASDQPSA